MKKPFYERHCLWITVLSGVLLPFILFAATRALRSNTNEVSDWLPINSADTAQFGWYQQQFGSDDFIIIAWENGTLDDLQLEAFAERLRDLTPARGAAGPVQFERVLTSRQMIERLTDAGVPRDEAVERLKGWAIGRDGDQACVIAWPVVATRQDRKALLAFLRQSVTAIGVPAEAVRFGGRPVINAAIDRVSAESLVRVCSLSCFVTMVIAWVTFRDVRMIVLIFVTGLYSAACSLAMVWLCGGRMNAILVTMIPMVYVTATSGAIHLCNYYWESVREAGLLGAAGRAVAHARVPLGLAAATTAAGLLSICYSDLVVVRQFGLFSAIGVGLSWVLLVMLLPSLLTLWPPHVKKSRRATAAPSETGEAPLPEIWRRLGEFVVRRNRWLLAGCLLAMAACAPGLWRVEVSVDMLRQFTSGAEILQSYAWLEERMGPLTSVEVIVRLDNEKCQLSMLDRVLLAEKIQRRAERLPEVGTTVSAATLLPSIRSDAPEWMKRGIFKSRIARERDRLMETRYLANGDGEELWRVSVRIPALRGVDLSQFLPRLRNEVEQVLEEERANGQQGISTVYTGLSSVLHLARRSLVEGLVFGLFTDVVLIVVTLTVTMRHWSSGFLMLMTSLFPAVIVLGSIGWLGLTIDIGAIMAPCVALGVTVDDVVHLLLWYRWGIQRGLSQTDAVHLSWQACARPIYQSWAILGLGIVTVAFSTFMPFLQFGLMMAAMLTLGLAGNLFFLLSLLSSPLGGIIRRAALRSASRSQPVEMPATDHAT